MTSPSKDIEGSSGSQPSTPLSFEFVNKDDRSQIRSHAMRESWRQRRGRAGVHRSHGRERFKRLPQRPRMTTGGNNTQEQESSSDKSVEKESGHVLQKQGFPTKGVYLDLRHTLKTSTRNKSGHPVWSSRPVHFIDGRELKPYSTLSPSEVDPFSIIQLTREDQELLHHWVKVYAYEAFGRPLDTTFDAMKDLYIHVDLASTGSVHGILAHSASHLAFLRQEESWSVRAHEHKMSAIRLVNQGLNDPMKATSDEIFSAVMKLVTFEQYWGTENAWNLHRHGLVQMIKKRGGLSTFSGNWRLETRIQLLALLPKPKWNRHEFSTSKSVRSDMADSYQSPHYEFVNFFDGIQVLSDSAVASCPVIDRAITFLQSLTTDGDEGDRLKCLFNLAIIFKDSGRGRYDLLLLEKSLAMTEHVWSNDVTSLRWMLLQGMGRGPDDKNNLERTKKLGEVATLLAKNPWRRIEDRLLDVLMSESEDEDERWVDNILEESVVEI